MSEFEDESLDCEHEWQESEVGCEDCGSHSAVHCWECGQYVDLVFFEDPREEEKSEAKNE